MESFSQYIYKYALYWVSHVYFDLQRLSKVLDKERPFPAPATWGPLTGMPEMDPGTFYMQIVCLHICMAFCFIIVVLPKPQRNCSKSFLPDSLASHTMLKVLNWNTAVIGNPFLNYGRKLLEFKLLLSVRCAFKLGV